MRPLRELWGGQALDIGKRYAVTQDLSGEPDVRQLESDRPCAQAA